MTSRKTHILIIEDDPPIRQFLEVSLEQNGYWYHEASNTKEGLEALTSNTIDIIILDLGLPDMDGLVFLKRLREWSNIPVIVLTARDRETDKIEALDQGADDYLTKPFGIGELLARIRAALRHAQKSTQDEPFFQNGDLKIDFQKREVLMGDKEVHLTPTEYKILTLLAKNAGKVVTQHHILNDVWGANWTEQGHYLRVHMHQLRHKIEANPARPKILINEPGVGYRMKVKE